MEISKYVSILFALINFSIPAEAQLNDDWVELQKVLDTCVGIYEGVNNNIVTSGLPDGPLLGNGKVGVAGACDRTWGRFYITTTDFWTGVHLNAIPLPIGGVNIIAEGLKGRGIRQEQKIREAEILTVLGDGKLKIRTWVSATNNLVISEIISEGSDKTDIRVETWTHMTNTSKYPVSSGIMENNIGWASRETESGTNVDWVCRAALATNIIGADHVAGLSGDNTATESFTLIPGKRVYIVTAVYSGKNITDHIEGSVQLVKDLDEPDIDNIHNAHLDWWKNYWLKSFVRTYDPQLEKFYYGALYESACCYRAGSICPGLFGAWVTTDKPNWNGNCTLSYNHQSTVVGFASSNRPELLLPYMQQRYDWEQEGRQRAKRGDINFVTGNRWGDKFKDGINGIFEPITQGPWGSSASTDLYMGMISGAVWGALPIIWYCNHTLDKDYISTIAYPYLKGLTDFWEDYLVKEDGKWIIKYSAYQEWASNDSTNPALDNAIVKELFKNMIQYSIDLDIDKNKRLIWKDIVDNMKGLPTGNRLGQFVFRLCDQEMLQEGGWPGLAILAGHTTAITMSSHDDLKMKYINSIDAYNSWDMICAPGYLWASAVKGGYPAKSLLDRFRTLLRKNMRRNFTVPTGGHGTESVANIEYINASMLQSQEGFLRLFPGWPNPDAKFIRLRAQEDFLVSSELTDNEVSYIEIFSGKGRNCSVLNPWPEYNVSVKDQSKKELDFKISGDKINFSTKRGETYYITKAGILNQSSLINNDGLTIKIGSQIWMTKNLDVDTFRNGDPIPEVKDRDGWIQAGIDEKPAFCHYDNNIENGKKYGKLYNWYAICDPRGLLPDGFHIPSESEWLQLASYLGGTDIAGQRMKNIDGFNALTGGYRSKNGNFYGMGINGYWWSSSLIFWDVMWDFVIDHKNSIIFKNYSVQQDGLYIRCIKD
jgi:uncharacterized protein (TIGR02145 family)